MSAWLAAPLVVATAASQPEAPADRELRALAQVLVQDADACRRWYFGWVVSFGVVAGVELAAARKVDDEGRRIDLRVGAFMSGLGFLSTLALPPPQVFDDHPRQLDAATLQTRLRRSARAETLGHSWLAHSLGIAANAAAGLYLAIHHRRPWSGLVQFLGGSAVSTLKIALLPTYARDLQRASNVQLTFGLLVGDAGPGVGLGVEF